MLYQLSHFRSMHATTASGGAESQDRTGDTAIFSRVLYQLSYLGPMANQASVARRLAQDSMPPQSASRLGGRTEGLSPGPLAPGHRPAPEAARQSAREGG